MTSFWNPNPKEKYGLSLGRFYAGDADDLFQDETVVTLSVVGITVNDAVNPFPYPLLSLAAPRRLVVYFFVLTDIRTHSDLQFSTPKPVIKLQFSSIALSENNSKESRIKLGLHGFTLNVSPNMKRMDALVSFAKSPPGVSHAPSI